MESENHQNCAGSQGQNDAAHDPGYVCKQNNLFSLKDVKLVCLLYPCRFYAQLVCCFVYVCDSPWLFMYRRAVPTIPWWGKDDCLIPHATSAGYGPGENTGRSCCQNYQTPLGDVCRTSNTHYNSQITGCVTAIYTLNRTYPRTSKNTSCQKTTN